MNFRIVLSLAVLGFAFAKDRASIKIVKQDNCPLPALTQRKGVDIQQYRPRVAFKNITVSFSPENPVVPGCFKVKVENVRVLNNPKFPVQELRAEYELKYGGVPVFSKDAALAAQERIKCGKTEQNSVCPCKGDASEDSCQVCGFCKNLLRDGQKLVFESGTKKKLSVLGGREAEAAAFNNDCACNEPFAPGTYTLETEICTPTKEEMMKTVSNDFLENASTDNKFTMWATIYIIDDMVVNKPGFSESYMASLEKYHYQYYNKFMTKLKSQSMAGCLILGYDVQFES